MRGHPKFKYNDKVKFTLPETGETFYGKIYIIDSYGTFDNSSDVSYDILVNNWGPKKEECLFKHITEKLVSIDNNEK